VRAGLQKLNFGSATLLRPLMWFDRVDPRDPLELADGVTGLLCRYYSLSNITLWSWVLLGNRDPKGWETLPTCRTVPELGGRVQVPLPAGEVALSVHRRTVEVPTAASKASCENRIGLDGKWDLGIALWVEATLVQREQDMAGMRYQKMANVGADYTLGFGNGLHLLGETLWISNAEALCAPGERWTLGAGMVSYPMSMVDVASAVLFYDWRSRQWYRFASWRRTLDKWQLYLLAFWNPEALRIYRPASGAPQFAGKGVHLLLVFNY